MLACVVCSALGRNHGPQTVALTLPWLPGPAGIHERCRGLADEAQRVPGEAYCHEQVWRYRRDQRVVVDEVIRIALALRLVSPRQALSTLAARRAEIQADRLRGSAVAVEIPGRAAASP